MTIFFTKEDKTSIHNFNSVAPFTRSRKRLDPMRVCRSLGIP